jgi:hypothetical protein
MAFNRSLRLSKSLSISAIDIRKPFSDYNYVNTHYGLSKSIQYLFTMARMMNGKTLIIENIATTRSIKEANASISDKFSNHKQTCLQRLTFWDSYIYDLRMLQKEVSSNGLLGYAIIKGDEFIKKRHKIKLWHLYESILKPGSDSNNFIPKLDVFKVKCGVNLFQLNGILFSGYDNVSTSCLTACMRDICTYVLGSEVSHAEIESILGPLDISRGLTLKDIVRLLEIKKIRCNVFDFKLKSESAQLTPAELIMDSISANAGVLLIYKDETIKHYHPIFLYGYALQPNSAEQSFRSSPLKKKSKVFEYSSISPWISSYIFSDNNLGPYCYTSLHYQHFKNPEYIITTIPSKIALDGYHTKIIGHIIINYFYSHYRKQFGNKNAGKIEILNNAVKSGDIIFKHSLVKTKKYIEYLRLVRDWNNNKEEPIRISMVSELLSPFKDIWIIEVTTPEFIKTFQKIGDIIVNSNKEILNYDEKEIWEAFIFARFPSGYMISYEKETIITGDSNIDSQTPFIHGGDIKGAMMNSKYQYQIALSFAGEDRYLAEKLASLLKAKKISVFYDKYEQSNLWGKDLYQHLQKIYRDMAQYCVVFVSKAYARKLWTKHELKQAQARAFQENEEYILPLKLDDTEIPGVNDTIGYLSMKDLSIETVADIILQKLQF